MSPLRFFVRVDNDGNPFMLIRIRPRPGEAFGTSDVWREDHWSEEPDYWGKWHFTGWDSDTDEVSAYVARRVMAALTKRGKVAASR